jgi:esterase/lipase
MPDFWTYFWWILGAILALGLSFYVFMILFASHLIYVSTLKRRTKDEWSRHSVIEDPNQQKMDALGQAWLAEHRQFEQDVHIVRDGLNLYGKYYDLGYKRCCMLLSGRTESLRYGYFFVKPYADAGWNVMVIDARSHGNSDGTYNTLGFEESLDDLAWAKFLHEEKGMEQILFHGICIGAAGGMLAITHEQCPDYIAGLVTEGMFAYFGYSMHRQLVQRKRNFWPVLHAINMWNKHYTGHSFMRGPIHVIDRMEKPLLMLHSKEDPISIPANAQKLYDLCPSTKKKLVWFDHGGHSLLRITNMEKYDTSIQEFLSEHFS